MNSIFAIVFIGAFGSLTRAAGMKAAITYPLPITNMYKNLFQHTVEDLLKCPNLANGLANTFITKIGEFQKQIDDDAKALASAKGKPPVDLSTSAKPPCLSKKNEAALFTFFIKPAKECWKQIKVEGTMIKNAEKQFQLDICASIQNKVKSPLKPSSGTPGSPTLSVTPGPPGPPGPPGIPVKPALPVTPGSPGTPGRR